MKKILFACDLDNTLLHSHRVKGEGDICAELLDGKEQSFITPAVREMVREIYESENITLLPVTTRSAEQYKRIKWFDGCTPELALVCNGSVLLRNGEPDSAWLEDSLNEAQPYTKELKRLLDKYSTYECFKTVRIVDEMFLFAYCLDREKAPEIAEKCSDDTGILDVQLSGSKLYFFPPVSNKGYSVKRFAKQFEADTVIAAGDSIIDCSMLDAADTALIPNNNLEVMLKNKNVMLCNENERFSEFILRTVITLSTEINFTGRCGHHPLQK